MRTYEDLLEMADADDVGAMVTAVQEFVWNMDPQTQEELGVKDKIINYVMKAIDAGSCNAMNQLGAMYAEGRLVKKDPGMSFYWYKIASEHGNVEAIGNLGFNYLYGNGTEQNYELAFRTFAKGAALGQGDSLVRLGDMYLNGWFVEKDPLSAFRMYIQAAIIAKDDLDNWGNQQVYSDALFRIGSCHYYGIGAEKCLSDALGDLSTALHFYELREARGDAYSAEGYADTKEMLKRVVAEL